jgi:hypothetical protein
MHTLGCYGIGAQYNTDGLFSYTLYVSRRRIFDDETSLSVGGSVITTLEPGGSRKIVTFQGVNASVGASVCWRIHASFLALARMRMLART